MILALELYFKLPFGRLNQNTLEVKQLAALINRTNSSVALRLVNYAACDPYILSSGRHGMASGKNRCMPYWNEFANNKELLFLEAEIIRAKIQNRTIESNLNIKEEDYVGKDRETVIRARVNQNAFRSMILSNYESRCAISGIDIPMLLVASHIKPWAVDAENRLNPENGICFSPLYDRLFDSGLITVMDDFSVLLSKELLDKRNTVYFKEYIAPISGKKLQLPIEHYPNINFLQYHYDNIFSRHN